MIKYKSTSVDYPEVSKAGKYDFVLLDTRVGSSYSKFSNKREVLEKEIEFLTKINSPLVETLVITKTIIITGVKSAGAKYIKF